METASMDNEEGWRYQGVMSDGDKYDIGMLWHVNPRRHWGSFELKSFREKSNID